MTSSGRYDSADQLVVRSRTALVELAAVLPATGRFVVARLDGTRMADADLAFYEFSDALLFPAYFGWNWDALSDCLRDLNWLPADGYLVVVDNVSRMLSSSADDRNTLFRVLSQAVRHWAFPAGQPEFTVLLLSESDDEAALLRQEIAQALRQS
ncbi:barstar family protein [Micromonospora sp. NPDC127501]|uniref:barstar family protein n=1 Tax=Micromonospora sp. NPDC127501 TaxID=3154872 RepID=UPI00331BDCBD